MNLSTNLHGLNSSSPAQATDTAQTDRLPWNLINYAFYPVRFCNIIYFISCVFWLFYIIYDIHFQLRYKRSLLKRFSSSVSDLIQYKLFQCREILVRNSIFLFFLSFEICFNMIGAFSSTLSNSYPINPMIYNCTEIAHIYTIQHIGFSLLSVLIPFEHFSFSMMIWLFGATLFHLSIAARNKLKIRALVQFIFGGVLLNMLIFTAMFSINPRIYAKIVQGLMDQVSMIVVLYISRKKFFPAMNSRVIDAFHLNLAVYNKQKRLLRRYKVLVNFLLITFELYALKGILYNTYLILHNLGIKSCLNQSYLIFPIPDNSTTKFLYSTSFIFLLFVLLVDSIVYFNMCLVNSAFICSLAIRFVWRRFFLRLPHRFHVLATPLNPHVITVIPCK